MSGETAAFGWATTELIKLVKICDNFRRAYSDGGESAAAHLAHLNSQVEALKRVLMELEGVLEEQDTKVYIAYDSIQATIKRFGTFTNKLPVYLQSESERTILQRLQGAAKYIWHAKEEANAICTLLQIHTNQISLYLAVLNWSDSRLPGENFYTDTSAGEAAKTKIVLRVVRHSQNYPRHTQASSNIWHQYTQEATLPPRSRLAHQGLRCCPTVLTYCI